MKNKLRWKEIFLKWWMKGSFFSVLLILVGVFFYIVMKGIGVLTPDFIFGKPEGMPVGSQGGIFPAIIGSLISGGVAGAIGGALSLSVALYMVFYCKSKKIYTIINSSLIGLAGIPSVVLGLFGYSFFIMKLRIPRSLLAASLTLAIMVIPFMTLRMAKAFEEISTEQLMASLSLGVSRGYCIVRFVIPYTKGRIVTAITLGMTFAMGATAPIMFTGAVIFADVPDSMLDSFMALPYHLYILANEGISLPLAYGTAVVLLLLLLAMNLGIHIISGMKGEEDE